MAFRLKQKTGLKPYGFHFVDPPFFGLPAAIPPPSKTASGTTQEIEMSQNCAEFHIIGRIGRIDAKEKVTYLDVASNYNRQRDGEWEKSTKWNRVTLFSKNAERAGQATVGSLVRITGTVEQSRYDRDGKWQYSVDLLVDSFAVLAKPSDAAEDQ